MDGGMMGDGWRIRFERGWRDLLIWKGGLFSKDVHMFSSLTFPSQMSLSGT